MREFLLGVPVFVKVMGIALGMVLFLSMGMLWQIHRTWHAHLVSELEQRGAKLAGEVGDHCAELSRAGLAADIPAELRHSLMQSPDVAYLILEGSNGVLLAEVRLSGDPPPAASIRESSAPFGGGTHRLRVGMSTARLDLEVGWLTRRLARNTAIITVLGLLAAWWLTRIFAHPIEELVALTRAVTTGNYQVRAPVRAADEIGELAAAFNEMTDAVARKEMARQQLLRQVIHAGEEERKRLARELHDHTGQALTSQIASLSALEVHVTDPVCRQQLAELRQQVEQTLAEVHDLSVALRPSVLDDIGLMAALDRHCRLFARRSAIQVACDDIGLDGDRLPAEVELTIYRMVQEALTNAVRHGKASRVSTLVQRTSAVVLTTIQDNGVGFDARDWQQRCVAGNHLGLLGIEERVQVLGGMFCVESAPGRGTTVFADIPLNETP
jgi:signal transduction histidine kinase